MKQNGSETDALLQRAAGGDVASVNALLQRHRDALARMVAVRMDPRVTGRVDPSDVIQETLTIASQRLSTYAEEQPIAFYPWLRQIAWEKLVQEHNRHLRAAKRSVAQEFQSRLEISDTSVIGLVNGLAGSVESPSQAMIREEVCHRLRLALESLREVDREVIIMRYLEHMSVRDIAASLDIGESAVYSRMAGAIERIRELLTDDDGEHC